MQQVPFFSNNTASTFITANTFANGACVTDSYKTKPGTPYTEFMSDELNNGKAPATDTVSNKGIFANVDTNAQRSHPSSMGSVICLSITGLNSFDSKTNSCNTNSGRHILQALFNSASVANEEKWLTIISSKRIESSIWREFGINPRYARVIYLSREDDLLWVTWEALAAGNSHTIITLAPPVHDTVLDQLNDAATKGNTRGIILSEPGIMNGTSRATGPIAIDANQSHLSRQSNQSIAA